MPTVSVIVPNYNHAAYLSKRLDSILAQTFDDFELIILDDCSSDNSQQVIERYRKHPRVSRIVYNETNSGSTFQQWQKGVDLASGQYLWIAESDDSADPLLLETLIFLLRRGEKEALTSFAYCQSSRMDAQGMVTGSWLDHTERLAPGVFEQDFVSDGRDFVRDYLIYSNVVPNASAVLFSREAMIRTGPIDASAGGNSDWLFWLKLAAVGKIAFSSRMLNHFRYHDASVIARLKQRQQRDPLRLFAHKYDLKVRKRYAAFLDSLPDPRLVAEIATSNYECMSQILQRRAVSRIQNDQFKRARALARRSAQLTRKKCPVDFRLLRKYLKRRLLGL